MERKMEKIDIKCNKTGYIIVGNNEIGYEFYKNKADIKKTNQFLAIDGKPFGDLPNGQMSKTRSEKFYGKPSTPQIFDLVEALEQAKDFSKQN
tara:strand:- start:674 stop:952 length:279 start_codon:yes stop_codon:yes gene_type:complete